MRQQHTSLHLDTRGKGLYEFTRQVQSWVAQTGIHTGVLTVYIQHTSASLTIQENADPDVQTDLKAFFKRLVPDGDPLYVHTMEGPDDMAAHVRSVLTDVSLSIPVLDGRPALGTWQGIYLFEHRDSPHRRRVLLMLQGE